MHWQVLAVVDRLLFQADVASNVYIAYEALCLFLSTPLLLFGTPTLLRLKRAAFRIPKLPFVCAVVAGWWCYKYLWALLTLEPVALFMHNFITDVRAGVDMHMSTSHSRSSCWLAPL